MTLKRFEAAKILPWVLKVDNLLGCEVNDVDLNSQLFEYEYWNKAFSSKTKSWENYFFLWREETKTKSFLYNKTKKKSQSPDFTSKMYATKLSQWNWLSWLTMSFEFFWLIGQNVVIFVDSGQDYQFHWRRSRSGKGTSYRSLCEPCSSSLADLTLDVGSRSEPWLSMTNYLRLNQKHPHVNIKDSCLYCSYFLC